ncbi:TetR/AcrR family transcriptional regulator [uncultured Jatrophihabitans sp.]|uniref:TetR/AcrR family transcriptional regulator n=1 Tax=uncultured Jatrophihabitans sp. TaxID=1610747 RepID=UPI0035CB7911
MPRPTWQNLDTDRRDRVLLAAMAEFGRHGYFGGSLNVVAREAGVAKGSLFQYFHDKSDLFGYVAEQASLRVYAAMAPHLVAAPDGTEFVDQFAGLVEIWIAYMAAHPLERGVTAATTLERDPQVRRAVREPVHRLYAQGIRPLLDNAVQRGDLRPDTDVDVLLHLIVMLLPHLAIAPFEPGLDAAVPLFGVPRRTRIANTRRLLDQVFCGVVTRAHRGVQWSR